MKDKILLLDTSSFINYFAIFSISKDMVVFEKEWKSENNEVEISTKLLDKNKKYFDDLQYIIAIRGPGNFTASRVCVNLANIIAFSYKIKIFGISAFSFLRFYLCPKEKNGFITIPAGKEKVFFYNIENKKRKILMTSNLPAVKKIYNEKSKKQTNRAKAMILASKSTKPSDMILPLYLKTAGITKMKKKF